MNILAVTRISRLVYWWISGWMDQTIHSKVMDFQRSDLHPLWASWVGNLQAQNGCQHGELSIHFVHRVSHFFLFVQNFTFVFKYNMDILILHKFWDEFCWFIVYFCLKGTKCEILCTKWKESSPCWQPFCACRLPTQGAHEGCKSDLWKLQAIK